MHCPKCGQENPLQAKFCLGCGVGLSPNCVRCQTALPAHARFCFACGHAVGEPAAPQHPARGGAPSVVPVPPRVQTPPHLAERIRIARESLEGERKQVTVLFADLKGSLEWIAESDPEEARNIIDPVIAKMIESVHRYEGTVNQVLGDGIMALFGAPLAHEDHAVRACYAALAMQSAMKRYNDEVRRAHGVELQIRVGLNSGEVLVRTIDNDLSLEYSAVGLTTHLAARMEQLATPGSVRLTAETLRLAEGFVQVTALGPVPVKGLDHPIEMFELTGASVSRSRLHASAARGFTRFVGRQAELESLGSALKRAAEGKGEVVALVGEAGMGKSRLVWEFTHSHRLQGWTVLESASVSYGKATAYKPLIDLLHSYLHIEDTDDARKVREKVTGKLLTLDRTFEPLLPAFLTLLDVPFENPEWQALVPSQRRQRILDACKRLLVRESQVQPLVVVFEDLHWIDPETQSFLDSLVDSLGSTRMLLLVNYRPEYAHEWAKKSYYAQLRIDPLTADSAHELLDGLVGQGKDLEPLRQMLIERTAGNPFFLEESVRTLVETSVLSGERGRYRLATPLSEVQVPGRVQAVLSARIDRLPADDKRLLQTAAVAGKDVSFPLLAAIAELTDEALLQALARLQAAEFLYETALFPEPEYTFKHALTHEVAYGSMLQERRRVVHARIVEAMEALYSDRLPEHMERLSQHAFRGQVWDKALRYLKQAGDKALARSAVKEAVAYFDQALHALRQLPATPERVAQEIDLCLELRNALHPLGETDRVLEILSHAQKLAEEAGDDRRLGRIFSLVAQSFRVKGEYARALETGERGASIGESLDDLSIQVTANFHLGQTHFQIAAHERAMERHGANVAMLKGDLARQRLGMAGLPAVFSRGHLAWSLAEQGDFAQAIDLCDEAVRLANGARHGYSQAFAEYCGGFVLLRKGEYERAIGRLEHGLGLCKAMNFRLEIPFAAAFLGSACVQIGRTGEGLALLEQGVEVNASTKMAANRALLLVLLGDAQRLVGKLDLAADTLAQASELAQRLGEAGWEAWSLLASAHLHAARGASRQSFDSLEAARRSALALGLRPLTAHCDLALGRLCQENGDDPVKAQAHLGAAAAAMREMGMQHSIHEAAAQAVAVG
jgi:class 3 adenylate cyclase/tetratricopeptide (TPR) repeat protein